MDSTTDGSVTQVAGCGSLVQSKGAMTIFPASTSFRQRCRLFNAVSKNFTAAVKMVRWHARVGLSRPPGTIDGSPSIVASVDVGAFRGEAAPELGAQARQLGGVGCGARTRVREVAGTAFLDELERTPYERTGLRSDGLVADEPGIERVRPSAGDVHGNGSGQRRRRE
jgi:hypothetical protein